MGTAHCATAPASSGRKELDAIVVNDISRPEIGFDVEENEVTILTRDGRHVHVPRDSKEAVAGAVLDELTHMLAREGKEHDGAARAAYPAATGS